MNNFTFILLLYVMFTTLLSFIPLIKSDHIEDLEEWFSPQYIYDCNKFNWFGAYITAFVHCIVLSPCMVVYICYKLFTVGRQ